MLHKVAEQFKGELSAFQPYATIKDREAWNGLDSEFREEIVRQAESLLGFQWPLLKMTQYMDFNRTGNRKRFEDCYFERRYVLSVLVLAECVENRGRFLDDIINGIFAICEESGWDLPAHNNYNDWGNGWPIPDLTRPVIDLFACETGATIATALYLLESVLDDFCPLITKRMRYELKKRIYTPYLKDYSYWMGSGDPGGHATLNNWTPWCTQNILFSAFLNEDCREDWAEILRKACVSTDEFLNGYEEDGCCDEGAQYYHHAGLCVAGILQVCNSVTGGAFEKLYGEAKIRNIAAYVYNVHVDDIYYINFADCSPVAGRCGAREFLFAKAIKDPAMMAFAAADFRKGLPELLFLKDRSRCINLFYELLSAFTISEMRAYKEAEAPAPDIYYPSQGLMIVRDDKLFLAAKGGDNNDSHNHNDVGSVTVYKDGKPLLIDVGVETYTMKTFSPERYTIWTMQSSYHNLPEINGCMQLPGEEACAENVVCDLAACTLDMDIEKAYPKESGIRSYHRKASMVKGQEIRIEDSFSWEEGAAQHIILNLMTYEKPEAAEPDETGRQCVFIGNEKSTEGAVGRLILENARVTRIEELPVTDERLRTTWKHEVYRIQVEPQGDKFAVRIVRD